MKTWHWISLGILTLLSIIIEFFFISNHDEHWWSSVPIFYIIFGFVGCAVIIIVSKAIGKIFLLREENYYDD